MVGPVDVFLSYASADDGLRAELEEHLALLERQHVIRAWHDRRITAGEDWKSERDERLTAAAVVLLLVSASYLASNYLHDEEMTRALERARAGKALVIPVLLRACDWESAPFAKLSALPRNKVPVTGWSDRDAAWTDVALGIREAIEKLLEAQARSTIPMEIDVEPSGAEVQINVRDARGARPAPHTLGSAFTRGRLGAFSEAITAAVARGGPLDDTTLDEARAIHAAFFQGTFTVGPAEGRVLHRLMIDDSLLQDVPWEALCKPGTSDGFWGASAHAVVARGVASKLPWEPRLVRGAVRVLAVAPQGGADPLRLALAEAIEDGSIEWLDPIVGPRAGERELFESLRRSKVPHVLHFIGHGGADRASPTLRLADDGGREARIETKSLARELAASFGGDLRLVVLEAGAGAKPGAFGSAAEVFAREGADAVVAFRWPIATDSARASAREMYRTLAGPGRAVGDVGAAVRAARAALLGRSAEGFSPILYLRGPGTVLFTFENRTLKRPGPAAPPIRPLAPALQSLLERPFALVVGDDGDDRAALRTELERVLHSLSDRNEPWMSLSTLTQRYALRFGHGRLHTLFQDALVRSVASPAPPLVEALARVVRPGVHVTLCWLPVLERALAREKPALRILVLQPSLLDAEAPPHAFERPAGKSGWKPVSGPLPPFDLRTDLVVLRLYGGYYGDHAPEEQARFTTPLLTEDDQLYGLIGAEGFHPPEWADELIAELRLRPGLFAGLSALDWRHRMLLRWLYDQAPAPRGSVALLRPEADPVEPDIWNRGGGLPGTGKIAAVREDPDALAAQLVALPVSARPR